MPTSKDVLYCPADESGLRAALVALDARGAALGMSTPARGRLAVVLEELYTNAMKHGNAQASGEAICVTLEPGAEGFVRLAVEYRGPPFDPLDHYAPGELDRPVEDRPVGRLGIVLVRGLSTSVEYQRDGECNCMRVVLSRS